MKNKDYIELNMKNKDYIIKNGILTITIFEIEELNISFKKIKEIKNLEKCTNLKILSCSYNQLEQLDLTKNVRLKQSNYDFNQIINKIEIKSIK